MWWRSTELKTNWTANAIHFLEAVNFFLHPNLILRDTRASLVILSRSNFNICTSNSKTYCHFVSQRMSSCEFWLWIFCCLQVKLVTFYTQCTPQIQLYTYAVAFLNTEPELKSSDRQETSITYININSMAGIAWARAMLIRPEHNRRARTLIWGQWCAYFTYYRRQVVWEGRERNHSCGHKCDTPASQDWREVKHL